MLSQGDCRSLARALLHDVESSVFSTLRLRDEISEDCVNDPDRRMRVRRSSPEQRLLDIWGLEKEHLAYYHVPDTVFSSSTDVSHDSLSNHVLPLGGLTPDVTVGGQDVVDASINSSRSLSSSSSLSSLCMNSDETDSSDTMMKDGGNCNINVSKNAENRPNFLSKRKYVECISCRHSNSRSWTFCEECGCVLSQHSVERVIPVSKEVKSYHDFAEIDKKNSYRRNLRTKPFSQSSFVLDTSMLKNDTDTEENRFMVKHAVNQEQYKQHWKQSGITGPVTIKYGKYNRSGCLRKNVKQPTAKRAVNGGLFGVCSRGTERTQHCMQSSGTLAVRQSCLWTSSHHSTLPGAKASRVLSKASVSHTAYIFQLPDEILLYIFSFLDQKHLAVCSRVNRDFYRVSTDSTLWREITIIKRQLADLWLLRLSQLQPFSLHLVCCQGGPQLSSSGLRQLFRSCANTLQELNISGCSGGELTGLSLLLHCSSRCHNLHILNISWCQISIRALKAVLEANQGICDLDLSGCNINDTALYIIESNLRSLKRLHLYGNSSITSASLEALTSKCRDINDLNVGQCCQVSNTALVNISNNLSSLYNIELRGCTQISDIGIQVLIKNSPQLQSIGLAVCQNIGDSALAYLDCATSLTSLDVTSCSVSNLGVQHVLCNIGNNLVRLMLGSTSITNASVLCISQYCGNKLEELDLSYCRFVTISSVQTVVQSCQRLKRLAIYGLPFQSEISTLQLSHLKIELCHTL